MTHPSTDDGDRPATAAATTTTVAARRRSDDRDDRDELIAAMSDVVCAFDTDEQLRRLARRAHQIAGADYAAVATVEADGTTVWRATDGAVADAWRSTVFPGGKGTAGRVVASNAPVIITDFPNNPTFPSDEFPAHVAEGMRTAFGVPLRAAGTPFGAVVVAWRRAVDVAADRVSLVQALGDLAAMAITRARLLEAERERAAQLAAANAELSHAQELLEQQTTELEMLNEEMQERNAELSARVAELDAVLDQMADGVLITDAAGDFVRVNPAAERIYGRPLADVDMARWVETMRIRSTSGEPVTVEEMPLRTALREQRVVEGAEWTAERPDGARIRLAGTAAPLYQGGRITGAVLVFRDVTERMRLVERVQEATAMKTRFFAQMSHELRTPINAILGYGNLIADGLAGEIPPQALAMVERMRRSGRHLLELVNDVLDISRLEAGKVRIEPTEFDLVELARDTMATVEPRVLEKGLTLSLDAPASLALCSDPARVRQILLNLTSNAVKFTERGSVTITLAPCAAPSARLGDGDEDGGGSGGGVALSVRDTGPGISPADLKLIFAEFVQVGPARPAKQEGTGLGLTISQRLARLLGGELRVESAVGRGSTFTLVLPARPPAEGSGGGGGNGAAAGSAASAAPNESAAGR